MPVKLETGQYTPDQTVTVYHWPRADKNGDGDLVYEDSVNDQGVTYAQNEVSDLEGNSIYSYLPPEGFKNVANYESQDNYVLVDDRGRVKRNSAGQAYTIKPGQALIIYPDGSYEHLEGDYAHTMFSKRHKRVDTAVAGISPVTSTSDQEDEDKDPVRRAASRVKKAS